MALRSNQPFRPTDRLIADLVADVPLPVPQAPSQRAALFFSESPLPLPMLFAEQGWCVDWVVHDAYRAEKIVARVAEHEWTGAQAAARLHVRCQTDPPEKRYQLAVLPTRINGEAELTRDRLQAAVQRLEIGGSLVAAVNHPRDRWLGEQVRKYPGHVRVAHAAEVTGYRLKKGSDKIRLRDFRCEFAFKDRGRLIRAISRPGVFSHRRIDPGARRLIDAMQIDADDRVLEIGCGAGTVALAAALRSPLVHVHAIDSHTRAIECTAAGAVLNEVADRLTTELCADGACRGAGDYHVVLGNPPYYAHQRIATLFLDAALHALRPGGHVWMVGKQAEWFEQEMPQRFQQVSVRQVKGYCVASGIKRRQTESNGAAHPAEPIPGVR